MQNSHEHKNCCASHSEEKAISLLDPVCGMTAAPNSEKAVTYKNIIYYFCSHKCVEKFRADPERYLSPKTLSQSSSSDRQSESLKHVTFTCPMHPEIKQLGPGTCPLCGMALEPLEATAEVDTSELDDMTRRFWIGLGLSLPLFFISMSDLIPNLNLAHKLGMTVFSWIQALLATPVVLWCGFPFFERAWTSFKTRALNMFSLIALGTGSAFLFSYYSLLFPNHLPDAFKMDGMAPLYFEAAAVIVTLVLMGQVLELRARARTNNAIKTLLELAPNTASRIKADGTEEEINLDQVQVGDHLRVKPGEKIPVDGALTEGHSNVDDNWRASSRRKKIWRQSYGWNRQSKRKFYFSRN